MLNVFVKQPLTQNSKRILVALKNVVELKGLVQDFMERKEGSLKALVDSLNERQEPFLRVSGRDYVAACMGIRVCHDICGYEVKVGWNPGAELLDCRPAYYGLTREQADQLYEAILSCVPGSTAFAEKQVRQGRMIQS